MPFLHSPPVFERSSQFIINTAYFAPGDLTLFIQSIETISHLERQRHRDRLRAKKAAVKELFTKVESEPIYAMINPRSPTTSAPTKNEDEPVMPLEMKEICARRGNSNSDSDENYYSGSGSAQNSPRTSVVYTESSIYATANSRPPTSDSEESGVFAVGQSKPCEPVVPIRPRSQVITEPKYRSIRSRIIGLILKREYAEKNKEAVDQQQSNDNEFDAVFAYESEIQRRDRVLNEMIKQQHEIIKKKSATLTKASKKKNKRGFAVCGFGSSPEERFLDKAMRYLTL